MVQALEAGDGTRGLTRAPTRIYVAAQATTIILASLKSSEFIPFNLELIPFNLEHTQLGREENTDEADNKPAGFPRTRAPAHPQDKPGVCCCD